MGSVETQHCIAPQVEAEILAIFASIFQENAPRQASENADLKVTRKLAEKGNAGAEISWVSCITLATARRKTIQRRGPGV